jgi:hypothetical protein
MAFWKSPTRFLTTAARLLMGLGFCVFGSNGFHNFIPQPNNLPAGLMAYFGALQNTHYMLPLIFGTQLLAGILLLTNLFVPLALVIIAPVIVNILALHIFLQPGGIVPGIIVAGLEIYLVFAYRSHFSRLFVMWARPD